MGKEKDFGFSFRNKRVYTSDRASVMRAKKFGLNPKRVHTPTCYVWEIEIPDSRTINLLSAMTGWQVNKLK